MDSNHLGPFKEFNDFLVDNSVSRRRQAGISFVVFDNNDGDPIQFLALEDQGNTMGMFSLIDELRNDLHEIRKLPLEFHDEKKYDEFRFRLYILSTISLINAIHYQLRNLTESNKDWEKLVTARDLKKHYHERLKFRDRIKVTFQIFKKVFKLNTTLDFSGEGWKKFETTARIRHKFAHPSKISDTMVTFEQTSDFIEGWSWFSQHFVMLMKDYKSGLPKSKNSTYEGAVALFRDDPLAGLTSKNFPKRNIDESTHKRRKALLNPSVAPKKLRPAIVAMTIAAFSLEDCQFVKSDNMAFRIRIYITNMLIVVECAMSQIIQLAMQELPRCSQKTIKRIKIELELEGSLADIKTSFRRLKLEKKTFFALNFFAIVYRLKWRYEHPEDEKLMDQVIELRDGLTHPKVIDDVSVTTQNYLSAQAAGNHYSLQLGEALNAYFKKHPR